MGKELVSKIHYLFCKSASSWVFDGVQNIPPILTDLKPVFHLCAPWVCLTYSCGIKTEHWLKKLICYHDKIIKTPKIMAGKVF